MVHYKSIKIMIDIQGLAKVIINIVVCHHKVSKSIITDWDLLFISKFWFLLCYFLGIKKAIYSLLFPKNSQIKRQNSIIEAYLIAFVNWEQNN